MENKLIATVCTTHCGLQIDSIPLFSTAGEKNSATEAVCGAEAAHNESKNLQSPPMCRERSSEQAKRKGQERQLSLKTRQNQPSFNYCG